MKGGTKLKVDLSKINLKETPILNLKNRSFEKICPIYPIMDFDVQFMYNEISTISFYVPDHYNGINVPFYDEIIGDRIIEWADVGRFIIYKPKIEDNGIYKIKKIQAYSMEYSLTQNKISLENNTYNFYNPVSNGDTIMDIVMEKIPYWSLGTVDQNLIGKYRTFEVNNQNLYDFIKTNLQETYNCIFDFDTLNMEINVVSADSDIPVKSVYLSTENLISNVEIDEKSEDIVTVLDVNGAEGVDIRSVNPMGNNKIYNLDYFMNEVNFPSSVIAKYNNWKTTVENSRDAYYNLTLERMSNTLRISVESAALTDLKGQLMSLEHQLGVLLAQQTQEYYDTSTTTQGLIDRNALKDQIEEKKEEIADKESLIENLKHNDEILNAQQIVINDNCRISSFFTEEEYIEIRKYFFEDEIQDSSFVVPATKSYEDISVFNSTNTIAIEAEDTLGQYSESLTKDFYNLRGGTIEIVGANNDYNLIGDIVRGIFEIDKTTNEAIESFYLKDVILNNENINNVNVTIVHKNANVSLLESDAEFIQIAVNGTLANIYTTRDTTYYEQKEIEWQLYEYGREQLNIHSSPSYSFDVKSQNFLNLEEFSLFANNIELGKRCYLYIDNKRLDPILISVEVKGDDWSDITLKFGDTYDINNATYSLRNLTQKAVSMGKTVDFKKYNYEKFVSSGASTRVREFMNSALDVAKNEILSSNGQDISFTEAGFRLRKIIEGTTNYDPDQIWMTNNSIMFTDSDWENAAIAIGKFKDPNVNSQGYCYGIVAPNIVGTLLAGENLVIESTKQDGGKSVFKVDGNGAALYNSIFDVVGGNRQISINPDFGIVMGRKDKIYKTVDEQTVLAIDSNDKDALGRYVTFWVDNNGNAHFAGDISAASGTFTGSLNVNNQFIVNDEGVVTANQGTFKGAVTAKSLFLGNSNTNALDENGKIKDSYLNIDSSTITGAVDRELIITKLADQMVDGDGFYTYTKNGKSYLGINATYIQAGKIQGQFGDNYWDLDTGEFRLSATTNIYDPTLQTSSPLTNFIESVYSEDFDDLKEQVDQKAETWYQSTDPSSAWNTQALKEAHIGDMWYYTGNTTSNFSQNSTYRWNGSSWQKQNIPTEVFDTIDGKAQIFVTQPTPPYDVGDLWFGGTNSDIKTCTTARASGQFDSGDWVKYNKYTDDSAVTNFISSVYTPKINNIEATLDGKIDTYFYNYVPTLSNIPASNWTTTELKNQHIDDLFYNTSTGFVYRFTKSGSTYSWTRIKDSDITAAMTTASTAQDTADGKRRVFVTQPTPPYDVGDLWTNANYTGSGKSYLNDLLRCKTMKASTGTFSIDDWELATKYTDDTAVNNLNDSLDQTEIFNRLTNNGALQGIYMSDGKLYINGTYIKSGVIATEYLDLTGYATFNDVKARIDDIEIGGRNLLRGSNEFTYAYDLKWENAHWYILSGGNGVAQINTINDAPLPTITKSISVLNNTTGNRDIGQRFIPTEIGETYTISGYVRIPSNSSYNSVTMLVRLYGSNTDISLNKAITNTEWKYFFVTGQAKTGTNRTCQFGLSGAGDIEYCGVKMEKGNKATDWTPAPEDVDDAIDVASQTATKYITYVDSTNGIRVHNAADTTDYVQVNSSAIGMYRNNTEKMRITDSLLRLGEASKTRTEISSSGVTLYDDSNDSIASFGSTARIGKTSSSRFLVNSDSLEAYNSLNEKYFSVKENGGMLELRDRYGKIGISYGGLYITDTTDHVQCYLTPYLASQCPGLYFYGSDGALNGAGIYNKNYNSSGATGSTELKLECYDLTNGKITLRAKNYQVDYPSAFRSAIGVQPTISKKSASLSSGTTVSVPSGSATSVLTLSLTAGTWLVFGFASIAGADAKFFKAGLSTTTSYNATYEASTTGNGTNNVSVNPWGEFTLTAATTIRLIVYHNAGSAKNCVAARINAYKIE